MTQKHANQNNPFDVNKIPLRALKIIRKNYRKNRKNPELSENLSKINQLIDLKERTLTTQNRDKLSKK